MSLLARVAELEQAHHELCEENTRCVNPWAERGAQVIIQVALGEPGRHRQ